MELLLLQAEGDRGGLVWSCLCPGLCLRVGLVFLGQGQVPLTLTAVVVGRL